MEETGLFVDDTDHLGLNLLEEMIPSFGAAIWAMAVGPAVKS